MTYDADIRDVISRTREYWDLEYFAAWTGAVSGGVDIGAARLRFEHDECMAKINRMEERLLQFTEGSDVAFGRLIEELTAHRERMKTLHEGGDLGLLHTLLSGWTGSAAENFRIHGGAEFPQNWANQVTYLNGLIAAAGGWDGLVSSARRSAYDIAELASENDSGSGGARNLVLITAAVLAGIAALEMPALAAATISVVGSLLGSYAPDEPPPENTEYDVHGWGLERITRAVDALDELLEEVGHTRTALYNTVHSVFETIPPEEITLGSTRTYSQRPYQEDGAVVAVDIAKLRLAGQDVFPHLAVGFELAYRDIRDSVDAWGRAAFNTPLIGAGKAQWDQLSDTLLDCIRDSRDYLRRLGDHFTEAAAFYYESEEQSRAAIDREYESRQAEWVARDRTEEANLETLAPDRLPRPDMRDKENLS
ncbi:hypothetical protein [Nocardia iowensis]|uniref:WXG100 family type VII secretion target n=1 Tax=Nocardia iowensis TaxID=204891 RepID=A0ABX8RVU2_NOCIO|nr:hypothetical protein [Nocardia iowensis]QXN93102.1 hypothetical protein KV110_08350 [Nocardia iowensis]